MLVKLGNYIRELIIENETVIIPGFGAFISKYKPAEIKEGTGEILPPSKEISFNSQIRNNDGLLVGYISEKKSVSHFDALKHIEKERENIIYQLDKREKVTLDETGVLFLNEKQEIQFESFIEENLLLDSYGLEPVLPGEEPEIPEEINPVHEKIEPEETDLSEIQIEDETIFQEEESSEKFLSVENNHPVEDILQQINENTEETIKEETEPEQITEMAVNTVFTEEPVEKKKRSWLWFLLIFIPIIIAGIFVANNNSIKKKTNADSHNNIAIEETQQKEESEILNTPLVNDSMQTAAIDSVQTTEPELKTNENATEESKRFYLVGGSFKEEENARKFIDLFNIEGYEPFYMGKIGNFYFVGLGKYDTEKKAVEARNMFFEKNPGSGSWVYEKPDE